MKTTTTLINELQRADPITRRVKLSDVEAVYGKGFAETLRRQLDTAENAKAVNASSPPPPRAKYRGR